MQLEIQSFCDLSFFGGTFQRFCQFILKKTSFSRAYWRHLNLLFLFKKSFWLFKKHKIALKEIPFLCQFLSWFQMMTISLHFIGFPKKVNEHPKFGRSLNFGWDSTKFCSNFAAKFGPLKINHKKYRTTLENGADKSKLKLVYCVFWLRFGCCSL